MKLIYLKSALKANSFDVSFSIKTPFFRILFTIEPGRSLLQFVTTNCLMQSRHAIGSGIEIQCKSDSKENSRKLAFANFTDI